jgi:hypothetical protein
MASNRPNLREIGAAIRVWGVEITEVLIAGRTPLVAWHTLRFASGFQFADSKPPAKRPNFNYVVAYPLDRLRTARLRPWMSPYPKLLGSILSLTLSYHQMFYPLAT